MKPIAVAIWIILIGSTTSYSMDAKNPDPLLVVQAARAAESVGNIDAELALYTDDAVITDTRGKDIKGREAVRKFLEANRVANFQLSRPDPGVRVDGNRVFRSAPTSSGFIEHLGVAPVEVRSIILIEGSKVRSINNYFPMYDIKRMEQSCSRHEIAIYDRPCMEFIQAARSHTEELIKTGLAPND
jgi:hypothetical protein